MCVKGLDLRASFFGPGVNAWATAMHDTVQTLASILGLTALFFLPTGYVTSIGCFDGINRRRDAEAGPATESGAGSACRACIDAIAVNESPRARFHTSSSRRP